METSINIKYIYSVDRQWRFVKSIPFLGNLYLFLGNLYFFIAQNDKRYRFPKKGKDFPLTVHTAWYYSWTLCLCRKKPHPSVWCMQCIFCPQNVSCRGWSPKFATGLNIIIGIVKKVPSRKFWWTVSNWHSNKIYTL